MANLGSLVVNLEANMARFTADMDRAAQQTEEAMGKIQAGADFAKNALGAIGVAITFDALLGVVNNSINALADLDDMAQKTGSSVENLSKLGKVAAMTMTDFGAVDSVLVKLAKNLGNVDGEGGKVRKALEAIGMSADGIKSKDPSTVFVEITRRLQDYEDGGSKVALMNDLMGESAAGLLPYMNTVAEQFDTFKGETAEAAATAAKFGDDIGYLRIKFGETTTAIVTAALPAATDFVGALSDLARESKNVTDAGVDSWADDIAVGLARVVDVAVLIPRALSAVAGSFKVVAADVQVLWDSTPANMAYKLAQGGSPMEDLKRSIAARNAVLEEANAKYDDLWNQPANKMEQAVLRRIQGRFDSVYAAGADALAGMVPPEPEKRKTLSYTPGEGKREKSDTEKAIEETEKLIAKLREQSDTYGMTGAALLEYQLRQAKIPSQLADQAVALQQNIDQMKAADEAQKAQIEAQKKAQEEAARAEMRNRADVERIRQDLMSEAEREADMHQSRLEDLQKFHDAKFENIAEANALIEAENARHEQAKADLQASYNMQSLGMAGDTADQLYGLMQKAGKEQTALGKAVFLASKAIAVAEIILSTEVAAAKAGAQLGIFGLPMAAVIRATGYASAGMVAGMAIAEASAEGGYDIPAGVNPVTQLHEKEMVLPKAQADVIRGLATRGAGDGGAMKLTIVNNTRSPIGQVTEQRISATERALIIQEAVAATASTLADPNSKTSRAMNRNFNVARSR